MSEHIVAIIVAAIGAASGIFSLIRQLNRDKMEQPVLQADASSKVANGYGKLVNDLQEERDKSRLREEALIKRVEALEAESRYRSAKMEELESTVARLTAELTTAQEKLAKAEEEIDELQKENKALWADNRKLAAELGRAYEERCGES